MLDDMSSVLLDVQKIAKQAGLAIMAIYNQNDLRIQEKSDGSPLTLADQAAHKIIMEQLLLKTPTIPILSEELDVVDYTERRSWNVYWLVDPLDGTKEFIKRNGEFTVNIALIKDGIPVLGVVYAPVLDCMYFAAQGLGAFKKVGNQEQEVITTKLAKNTLRVVASRSHRGEILDSFLEKQSGYTCVSMGSSLKICLIADGAADLYPRLAPTMEWDTAAADAVVRIAGGAVCDLDGQPLQYNKPNLLNPFFAVFADFEQQNSLYVQLSQTVQAHG